MPADEPTHDRTRTRPPPAEPSTGPFPLPPDTAPAPPPVDVPPEPPRVPGYALDGVLGRGGMGVVHRATQTTLRRPAAVKVLLAGGHATAADILRLRAEAATVAALDHPNVVRVYDAGDAGGVPYLAMELCPGGSLADRLEAGPLPMAEAVAVVAAIARGVGAAHAAGIVHRDLKPGNVLFAADGTPKVADFGLAKSGDSGLTATFAVMGTPAYMAPEQAEGRIREVSPAADVWAVGCILYECLTGRPPFRGETPLGTLDQVRFGKLVPPRKLNPSVPAWLAMVCLRCLSRKPAERYPSAWAVTAALEARVAPERPLRRRLAAAVAVLGAVVATAGLWPGRGRTVAGGSERQAIPSEPAPMASPPSGPGGAPDDEATELGSFLVLDKAGASTQASAAVGHALIIAGSDDPDVARVTDLDLAYWQLATANLVPAANRRVVNWAPDRPLAGGRRFGPSVRSELTALAGRATDDDTVVVVFTGTGFAPNRGANRFAFVSSGRLNPDNCVTDADLSSALAECKARVKLVFFDAGRQLVNTPWPDKLSAPAWSRVTNHAVYFGCSAGHSAMCDAEVGSYLSRAAFVVLSGTGAERLGGLTVADFDTLLSDEYGRIVRDRAKRPGMEWVAKRVRSDTPKPEVVGNLERSAPLFRAVEPISTGRPPRPETKK